MPSLYTDEQLEAMPPEQLLQLKQTLIKKRNTMKYQTNYLETTYLILKMRLNQA